ncbi:hypothetical protein ACLBX9_18600 [Methylobacterium sp. A49B]|uniref:Uncharacterized protein n=1 Tax=Methylobacterium mesophilicum SR1.6/6 TaxID=908290 RepID=A0A6B9F9V2_9HYPH|nr:hypothetical protein [Methylobacterium mesophilicum]QGY00711.1 hypothetical protein MMSR116_01395 [Methylobacterium mesophilicum SR1.6/6]
MAERRKIRGSDGEALSRHILPSAGTMVGVCTTLIGLVKIVEGRVGPSHVDEAAALTAILFLVGAIASYLSIRLEAESDRTVRLERCADICFVLGLVSLTMIAVLFAYETI